MSDSTPPKPSQLLLWETVVQPRGNGHAVVAQRPVSRRVSVTEALRILRPLLGAADRKLIYAYIAAGILESVKPADLLPRKPRPDGHPSNSKHWICLASLERLADALRKGESSKLPVI
jgi:hypothetical protein